MSVIYNMVGEGLEEEKNISVSVKNSAGHNEISGNFI